MNPYPVSHLVRATAVVAILQCAPLVRAADVAPAQDASPEPAQLVVPEPPAQDDFPVMSLAKAGVDPHAFMTAVAPLYDGSMIEVHSVLVLSHGALIFEDYFEGNTDRIDFDAGFVRVHGAPRQWRPEDLHHVSGVAKAVTSLVAGIAFAELGWSIDDPLASHLAAEPWLLAGDKSEITARHILTMTSGIQWDEWHGSSLVDTWAAPARFRHIAALPMDAPPGDRWTYNGAAPNILMLALDQAIDGGVRGFADERFFQPLGIDNYRWGDFENDVPDADARLSMRPRDMAKIGLLILNAGAWHGKQVVPRDYVLAATSPQVSTAPAAEHEYGYLIWIRKLILEGGATVQYVAIEGDGGNDICVFPDRDLVVVTTGGNYREFPVYEAQGQRILRGIAPLFGPPPAVP